MSISKSIAKVDYAIYQDPSLIPVLFKDTSIPKGLLYSRLRRAVPHRIGIEFEGVGEFLNNYLKDHGQVFKSESSAADYFGVKEIKCDTAIGGSRPGRLLDEEIDEVPIEEVRVSIESFKQLNGLKKVLDELSKYITIMKGCGIHIHVDMSDYLSSGMTEYRELVAKYLNNRLPEIESIFPKYKGHYNKRVAKCGKQSYVNVSVHNTLEFRIAPLTFNYSEIIQWVVKCCKLASKVIQQCHLKPITQTIHKSNNPTEFILDPDGVLEVNNNINDEINIDAGMTTSNAGSSVIEAATNAYISRIRGTYYYQEFDTCVEGSSYWTS